MFSSVLKPYFCHLDLLPDCFPFCANPSGAYFPLKMVESASIETRYAFCFCSKKIEIIGTFGFNVWTNIFVFYLVNLVEPLKKEKCIESVLFTTKLSKSTLSVMQLEAWSKHNLSTAHFRHVRLLLSTLFFFKNNFIRTASLRISKD